MLIPGARLGPYEILGSLGAGGMGEVYRARDTKLNREVAIKILLASVAADPDRLLRFTREAQLLASLNHPNIAHVHGVEDASGIRAIVMEMVDGPTLADRIARGPLPLEEALPIAAQIAEALEAAHAQGIIHRDLKPANVKVRPDGTVKVLDFGLAKALDPVGVSDAALTLEQSPTITSPAMTAQGVILGTAAYMSPEQARGQALDKRTDLWSFGCVLYEMLTARAPFAGGTVSDVIAGIISRDADWTALPAATPPSIRRLLRRCLEKDRRRRLPDAADARLEIDETESAPTAVATVRRGIHPMVAAVAVAGISLVTALAVWAVIRRTAETPLPTSRFAIVAPQGNALVPSGLYRDVAVSANGVRIAYVGARGQLYVRALDQLEPAPVGGITNAIDPFLSPDGRWVAFFTGVSGELRKVSADGGPITALCRYTGSPRGGSWGADGTIVFATNEPTTGLFRIAASGGTPEMLTAPERSSAMDSDHLFPSELPGGRGVLFTVTSPSADRKAQIELLDLKTRKHKTLVQRGSQAEYAGSGHLVYVSAGSLWAVSFDLDALEVRGDPVLVLPQVMASGNGAANFSMSSTGTLVYVPAVSSAGGPQTNKLVWVRRDGREDPIPAPPRLYRSPRLSPDGARVVFAVDQDDNDIFTWDFARATLTRLTFDKGRDFYPSWSPDGRYIFFESARTGVPHLYRRRADGTGSEEELTDGSNVQYGSPASSPDGSRVLFTEVVPGSGEDVMELVLSGTRRVEPLLHTVFAERNGRISPDGRWLAYESNESGQEEIYVRPFPNVTEGEWQISIGGGKDPVWAPKGDELFYRDGTSVMAAVVQTSPVFRAASPTKLFDGPYVTALVSGFDVSRDGQRFLMIKETAAPPPATIVVIVNWVEELKNKLPRR